MQKAITIVVPVYNMGEYAESLLDSLLGSESFFNEILFIDDGSSDESLKTLNSLRQNHALSRYITVIPMNKNVGRFEAIRNGVVNARCEYVLISNIRTHFTKESLQAGSRFLETHTCVMPAVRIDERKSIYSLYWQRTHEWLFNKNYEEQKKGFVIDAKNFEDYVKGTGGFICKKDDYLNACNNLPLQNPASDDIFILRYFAEHAGIWVQEDYYIFWEPRQTLKDFLMRMWERGPGFVEYNLGHMRGAYWKIFLLIVFSMGALLLSSFIYPGILFLGFILGLAAIAFQTFKFSKTFKEFCILYPLHLSVVLFFSAGIAYGIGYFFKFWGRSKPVGASRG